MDNREQLPDHIFNIIKNLVLMFECKGEDEEGIFVFAICGLVYYF